eukprot:2875889-Pleurochrysis_carterae.AAC.1
MAMVMLAMKRVWLFAVVQFDSWQRRVWHSGYNVPVLNDVRTCGSHAIKHFSDGVCDRYKIAPRRSNKCCSAWLVCPNSLRCGQSCN